MWVLYQKCAAYVFRAHPIVLSPPNCLFFKPTRAEIAKTFPISSAADFSFQIMIESKIRFINLLCTNRLISDPLGEKVITTWEMGRGWLLTNRQIWSKYLDHNRYHNHNQHTKFLEYLDKGKYFHEEKIEARSEDYTRFSHSSSITKIFCYLSIIFFFSFNLSLLLKHLLLPNLTNHQSLLFP